MRFWYKENELASSSRSLHKYLFNSIDIYKIKYIGIYKTSVESQVNKPNNKIRQHKQSIKK